jgi:hypothetical protein
MQGPKIFKRTDSIGVGRGAHYHIVYLNEEKGIGAMSQARDGHVHEVIWQPYQPPVEPQIDPMTGMPLDQGMPEVPEGWVIAPDPEDGHEHVLEEVQLKAQPKKQLDDDIVSEVHSIFRDCRELEADSFRKGIEADDFFDGEQWPAEKKLQREANNRACLVLNYAQHYVNKLCGAQARQRSDIKYAPVGEGDGRVADAYSAVAKHVLEQCYYDREEGKVFKDACIVGRGNFTLSVNFDSSLEGDIKVEKLPWMRATFGEHEKEDLSDCEVLIKDQMYSMMKLKQFWPKVAEEIEINHDTFLTEDASPHKNYANDQYGRSENRTQIMLGGEVLVDIARKEYRVIECWRRIYKPVSVLANVADEFFHKAERWNDKDIEMVRTIPGFVVVERNIPKIRITKVAGSKVLSDEDPADLPTDDFFVVPVYCEKRGNRFYGKIEAIKDSQREVNYRRSQTVDIGNMMSSYGWFIDDTLFPEGEKAKFEKNANKPGFVVTLNDVTRQPSKTEGSKFPSEIANLIDMEANTISLFLDTSVEDAGANTSGAAIHQRQQQKMLGHEQVFQNLSFAKRKLGRLLLSMIRKYYSPQRILRILKNRSVREEVMLGDQALDSFTDQEIITMLETADIGEYDVAVVESAWSPTSQAALFGVLVELYGKGVGIPPEVLIETAPDIPEATRKKMLDAISAQVEADAQGTQAMADAEVEKTLAAKGIYTPRVQQMMTGGGVAEGSGMGDMPAPEQAAMQAPQAPQGMPMDPSMGAMPPQVSPDPSGFDTAPSSYSPEIGLGGQALSPEVLLAESDKAEREDRMMMMTEQMVQAIQKLQPPPVVVNNYLAKPSASVGSIVRDPNGNAQIRIDDVPEA